MAAPTTTTLQRLRADRFGPAQVMTLVLGLVFLAIGIAGFAVTGVDDFFAHDTGEELLWFGVNPAHNLLHLLFGALGVILAGLLRGAWIYGWIVGIGYLGALAYGLVAMDETWDVLMINAADNWLHLVLAVLGFAIVAMAGAEMRRPPRSATGTTR